MKFKIKIFALVLLMTTCILSLSSCLFIDFVSDTADSGGEVIENATINTGDINNYDVEINSSDDYGVIATSKALMSAVSIVTDSARGSGVIFKMNEDKSEAYILTNYHVIYDADSHRVSRNIKAYLYGQESFLYGDTASLNYSMTAEYLGGTVSYDLAVIKIRNNPILMESNAVACDFADSNGIAVLEPAIAVGNAEGNGISATMGRVNVDSEEIKLYAADDKTVMTLRVMRTDAAVNSGNSGGGLFNVSGELIGIVNAKSVDSGADNIGFAIPSNVAKYIAENIIYYCDGESTLTSAYRCMLGVTVRIAGLYTEYDTAAGVLHRKERIEVLEVSRGAAAEGLLYSGDVINYITIDDEIYEVTRRFHVVDAMLNARVNSNVVVNVTRNGQKLDVTVPLSQSDIINADS